MRNRLIVIVFTIIGAGGILLGNGQILAQNSFGIPIDKSIEIERLDMSKVIVEDQIMAQERGLEPVGRVIEVDYNTENCGEWIELDASDYNYSWIQKFHSPNASYLNLYLSNINLNSNGKLMVRSEEQTIEINSNHSGKPHYATFPMSGSEIELCYYTNQMPSAIPFELVGIGVGYSAEFQNNNRGGDCNVDINCSEGDNWQEQKDAVVRLIINEGGVQFTCSGTLMNNTSGDQRRLILSALHCMSETTDTELETAIVTFNYEKPNCDAGFAPEDHFLVGLERLADSNDSVEGQSNPSGSDFVLVEIQDEIPSEWNPYWAGWNALNQASSFGRAVHHPSGNPKKISTFNSTTVSTNVGAPGSHWAVQWVQTANGHGVTAPGSSGSPLFNSNGLVMGTLTGGFSACENIGSNGLDGIDYFGKLSYHWLNNPNSDSQKLKVWLDPGNTGASSLEGSYNPVMNTFEVEKPDFNVFPSITSNQIHITTNNSLNEWSLELYSATGSRVLTTESFFGQIIVSVEELSNGVYIAKLTDNQGSSISKKFLKN